MRKSETTRDKKRLDHWGAFHIFFVFVKKLTRKFLRGLSPCLPIWPPTLFFVMGMPTNYDGF